MGALESSASAASPFWAVESSSAPRSWSIASSSLSPSSPSAAGCPNGRGFFHFAPPTLARSSKLPTSTRGRFLCAFGPKVSEKGSAVVRLGRLSCEWEWEWEGEQRDSVSQLVRTRFSAKQAVRRVCRCSTHLGRLLQ